MFQKFLVRLGLSKPDLHDVMDKFIRNNLTSEEIDIITLHPNLYKVYGSTLHIDSDKRVYIIEHYTRNGEEYEDTPSCERLKGCLEYYRYGVFPKMKVKAAETKKIVEKSKKYYDNRKQKLQEEELQKQYCLSELWKSMAK